MITPRLRLSSFLLSCFFILSGCSKQSSHFFSDAPEPKTVDEVYQYLRDIVNEVPDTTLKILNRPIRGPQDLEGLQPFQARMKQHPFYEINYMTYEQSNNDTEKYAKVGREAWSRLSREEVRKLLTLWRRSSDRFSNRISIAGFLPSPYEHDLYLEKNTLEDIIFNIAPRVGPVRWNGVLSKYDYQDKQLEEDIFYLAAAMIQDHVDFTDIFDSLPEEKRHYFTHNTNSTKLESKYELFDLLQIEISEYAMGRGMQSDNEEVKKVELGPPFFHAAATETLRSIFGDVEALDPRIRDLPFYGVRADGIGENRVMLGCIKKNFVLDLKDSTFQPSRLAGSGGRMSTMLLNLGNIPKNNFSVECDDERYNVKISKAGPSITLPIPQLPNFSDSLTKKDSFDVLITVSLVDEIDKNSIAGMTTLLAAYGYYPSSFPRSVSSKEEFQRLFPNSDMFISAGHTLQPRNLLIGIEEAIQMKFLRSFTKTDGSKAQINLTMLLPPMKKKSEAKFAGISSEEMGDLLWERRKHSKVPMIMMNTTCFGSNTIRGWSANYFEAVKKALDEGEITSPQDVTDTPIVFAAKRGFDTDHKLQIVSHFLYPLHTIDMIVKGRNLREIKTMLQVGPPPSYVRAIINALGSYYKIEGELVKSFEPVVNVDNPDLFDMSQRRLKIWREDKPEATLEL